MYHFLLKLQIFQCCCWVFTLYLTLMFKVMFEGFCKMFCLWFLVESHSLQLNKSGLCQGSDQENTQKSVTFNVI